MAEADVHRQRRGIVQFDEVLACEQRQRPASHSLIFAPVTGAVPGKHVRRAESRAGRAPRSHPGSGRRSSPPIASQKAPHPPPPPPAAGLRVSVSVSPSRFSPKPVFGCGTLPLPLA
jgi:hypothetical protein